MKKVCMLVVLILMGCAPKTETNYIQTPSVVQNCTVTNDGENALITCPDGSTITLPPNIITQVVEVPVEVECHHDNGNHYGQDKHDD